MAAMAFTPATIDRAHCMSRVWASGCGAQCGKKPATGGNGLCILHSKQEKLPGGLAHGRVDGPVPAAKLKEFEKAAAACDKRAKAPVEEKAVKSKDTDQTPKVSRKRSLEKSDKKAKRAAKKDPNRPKRPTNAFWLWLRENRAALTAEVGEGSVAAVAKLAGERWTKCTPEEKAPFEKAAQELKSSYEKAMEEYRRKRGVASDVDEAAGENVEGSLSEADEHLETPEKKLKAAPLNTFINGIFSSQGPQGPECGAKVGTGSLGTVAVNMALIGGILIKEPAGSGGTLPVGNSKKEETSV